MQLIVRAFPVLPGREKQMRQLAAELQTARIDQAADFYQRMGVARESWHLQETPNGTWVIGVTQIPSKPIESAGKDYAASKHPFDRWFKQQITLLTGIDPESAPLGPPTECIFDTHRTDR